MVALTGFLHRVYFNKFTTFFGQSQRKTLAITPKKPQESLYSMPNDADSMGQNSTEDTPLFCPKEHGRFGYFRLSDHSYLKTLHNINKNLAHISKRKLKNNLIYVQFSC